MRRIPLVLVVLALLPVCLSGQVLLQSGYPANSGPVTQENVVRDASGTLWCLSMLDDGLGSRPLLLHTSTDGGTSWSLHPFLFNDAASGLTGPLFVDTCALAIDDLGTLHALWCVYYTNYNQQYYRQFNPTTLTSSAILNVTAHIGSTFTIPTAAIAIAVDQANVVWLTCHGLLPNTEALARSNLPYASDLTFTRIHNLSVSGSCEAARLVVDVYGLIHCTYYRNTAPGTYEHRYYDPVNAVWGPATTLGNSTPFAYGDLTADALGNVHCVYVLDPPGAVPWQFRYRRWNLSNGWSPEIFLMDVPVAAYTGIANYYILGMACDELTGKTRIVYRNLASTGSLDVVDLPLGATAFTPVKTLAPPHAGLNRYFVPTVRGTLYPASNNCGNRWDITWCMGPSTGTYPYGFWFQRLTPPASISLTGPPAIGSVVGILLSSPTDGGRPYACGLSLGTTPGIVLPDSRVVPLNWDLLFEACFAPNFFILDPIGFLDIYGNGQATLLIPYEPLLVNATIYSAFVTADPLAPSGIGNISPALPITFQ